MKNNEIIMAIIGKRNGGATLSILSNILDFSLNKGDGAIVFRMLVKRPKKVDAEFTITNETSFVTQESETGERSQDVKVVLQFAKLKHKHYYLTRIKDIKPIIGRDEKFTKDYYNPTPKSRK